MCEFKIEALDVHPLDAAKTLLEAEGYVVIPPPPPKPKLTGKVVVWTTTDGRIHAYTEADWLRYGVHEKNRSILANIDWTEGDGIVVKNDCHTCGSKEGCCQGRCQ